MKRPFIKKMLFILVGIIVLLPISGCSTPIIAENAVYEDIKSSDPRCSTFDFIYDSMEITKRLTDEEDKKDTVWAKFVCHNEEFEYTAEYIVTYILYNDGWKFENCQIANASYIATSIPDDEIVISSIVSSKGIYVDEVQKDSIAPNTYTCTASATVQNGKYLTATYGYTVELEFTPEQGWYAAEVEQTSKNENWDKLIGKWTAVDDGDKYEIEILSVNTSLFGGSIKLNFYSSDYLGYFENEGRTYILEKSTISKYDYIARIRNNHGILVYSFGISENGLFGSTTAYTKVS